VTDADAHNGIVSVLMSVYNRAEYVDEAVRSVLADTSATHELVVIDDGSTDGADVIAAAYADRAVFLRQDHRGCAAAWNLGLRHAATTLNAIAPLGADGKPETRAALGEATATA